MKNKHENPKYTGSVSPDKGGQHGPDYPLPSDKSKLPGIFSTGKIIKGTISHCHVFSILIDLTIVNNTNPWLIFPTRGDELLPHNLLAKNPENLIILS
jgi:hypothetical protein